MKITMDDRKQLKDIIDTDGECPIDESSEQIHCKDCIIYKAFETRCLNCKIAVSRASKILSSDALGIELPKKTFFVEKQIPIIDDFDEDEDEEDDFDDEDYYPSFMKSKEISTSEYKKYVTPCGEFSEGEKVDCGDDIRLFISYAPSLKKPYICLCLGYEKNYEVKEEVDLVAISKIKKYQEKEYKEYYKFEPSWVGKEIKQKKTNKIFSIVGRYYNYEKRGTEICIVSGFHEVFILSNEEFLKDYVWSDGKPCGEEK